MKRVCYCGGIMTFDGYTFSFTGKDKNGCTLLGIPDVQNIGFETCWKLGICPNCDQVMTDEVLSPQPKKRNDVAKK